MDCTYFTDECYVITGASYDASGGLSAVITINATSSTSIPYTPLKKVLTIKNGKATWD